MLKRLDSFSRCKNSTSESILGELEDRPVTVLESGKVYKGQWLKNTEIMQGWGVSTNSRGTLIYEGWFQASKAHGKGRMINVKGMIYTGDFRNGLPDGQGECTYPDKSVYVGGFINGARSGRGTHAYQNGSIYEGGWYQD